MAPARRGYRRTAHHRRARTRLRRPHRPERGRQPASHDDLRRLSRRRRALRHRLRVRRWRRSVRLDHAASRYSQQGRAGRRLDTPAADPRDGSRARGRVPPTRAPRARAERPRSCSRRRSTRSTSRSSVVAGTRSGCGPRTTASASRRTLPRSSTSTPSARRSSWPPPSMPTRPPNEARRSATARRSISRSRPTTRGCRCGSSRSASPRPRRSRPTSTCSPMSGLRCSRTPEPSASRRA